MKIEIRCPSCRKRGFIEVSEEKIRETSRGLLAINVSENIICEHSFVAYVDKNLEVRDCFMADFQIEIPVLKPAEPGEAEKAFDKEKFDLVLLKLNFPATSMAYLLKGILSKQKLVILNDQKFLDPHLKNFIEYISENLFEPYVDVIPREIYLDNKNKYSDYVILDENKIIQNEEQIVNNTELNVERTIIQKFLSEMDQESSVIILRNELEKAYTLANSIIELINNFEGKELQSKKIIDYLIKKHNIDIKIPYLNFLLSIVKNYFGVKVPKSSEVGNFLGFL
jgi:regulator of sigma D